MASTLPPSHTSRPIKKEFTLAAERNERLEQLAERRRISENEVVERALDLYFRLSEFFETGQERAEWSRLSEAALRRVWDNEQDAVYDNWRELYGVPEG